MEWIMRANPQTIYDLPTRLADPAGKREITWNVPSRVRANVKSGDGVLFAIAGKKAAVYARGVILTDVFKGNEWPSEFDYAIDKAKFEKAKHWVIVAITEQFFTPIPLADIRQVPGLERMAVFGKFQQIGMFAVTDQEVPILEAFIDANKSTNQI